MITKLQLLDWLQHYAAQIAANAPYLTELDAAIGDADHGINMERGFTEVLLRLPEATQLDCGGVLKMVGMTLLSKVGGASGPLYGTLFIRLAAVAAQKEELSLAEFTTGLASGLSGIQQRGSAQVGEKTLVDTLTPALSALQEALESGLNDCQALRAAAASAEMGMLSTIPLQATKGRASYLGPRSVGHQDPGATSSWLLMRTLADAVCQ
jgi:dihydroxyacetone kinase-like protein